MSLKPQNIQLTFADGRVSNIDEDVHKLILEFQRQIKSSKSVLPFFFDLSSSLKNHSKLLLEFYSYALKNFQISKSQLFQDLFVLFIDQGAKNGTYLEFGETNGVELSNSFTLEKHFGWTPEQLILMADYMNGSDVFVRAGDLVKNRSGVRFLIDIANTYAVDCDGHEAVLVNGHWMGTGYGAQSFTMMTSNEQQAHMVGFEFDDVRPLCREVQIPTADRGQRGSLRIVR